jgi:hypothetical protein
MALTFRADKRMEATQDVSTHSITRSLMSSFESTGGRFSEKYGM